MAAGFPAAGARWGGLFALAIALGGCSATALDLSYYLQTAQGHFAVQGQARPIDELLSGGALDQRVAPKLRQAQEIREFAIHELALPANGSFRSYADIGRPFVVWNVFAAPELSLKLKQWCFPVAGCVTYRGYFERAEAERQAQSLRAQGWEVQVAGVPAYSTLGWFDDPLLSTFIHYPEGELARLMFHELAHQVVYLKGDSAFNESFAVAVEEAGVERWLARRGDPTVEAAYRQYAARRAQFVEMLKRHRLRLETLYASGASDEAKRAGKAEVFASLQAGYRELKSQWGGFAGYDRWFGQQLGNAHLAAVATYTAWVPGFRRLLAEQDGDMHRFFDVVRRLAREDKGQRDRMLARADDEERRAAGAQRRDAEAQGRDAEARRRDAPRMTLSSSH